MSSLRGNLDGLSAEEMEQFLAGNAVARLATLKPDGSPYLVSTLQQPRWLIKMVPTDIKTWKGVGRARRYCV